MEPGVVDFVAVVGCKDIGKQKNDDGSKGWVNSNPESVILEQFPPQSDYHVKNGLNVLLPEMVQWFCICEKVKKMKCLTFLGNRRLVQKSIYHHT